MPYSDDTKMTRIYVDQKINNMVDIAHVRVMSIVGRKMPKTEFVAKALEFGLHNEAALVDYYKTAV